jgi:hypothetical protein
MMGAATSVLGPVDPLDPAMKTIRFPLRSKAGCKTRLLPSVSGQTVRVVRSWRRSCETGDVPVAG